LVYDDIDDDHLPAVWRPARGNDAARRVRGGLPMPRVRCDAEAQGRDMLRVLLVRLDPLPAEEARGGGVSARVGWLLG